MYKLIIIIITLSPNSLFPGEGDVRALQGLVVVV